MKLPERMYYPLSTAAKKLGCTIDDLIHFAAIGAIDVCVFVEFHGCNGGDNFDINLPVEYSESISEFGDIFNEQWRIDFVEFKEGGTDDSLGRYTAKAIRGFFYVSGAFLTALEFDINKKVKVVAVSTKPSIGYDNGIDVLFPLNNTLTVDVRMMCIKSSDMDNIKDNGKITIGENNKHNKSGRADAKISELMPAVLKMIPELADVDLDNEKIAKIVSIIEATAAQKGIVLPDTHRQTWQKYLGR